MTALLATLAATLTVRSGRRLGAEARDQSYLSARAFAQSVSAWVEREDRETLAQVTRLMLAGSSVYVQVVSDGAPLVSEARLDLPEFATRPANVPSEPLTTLRYRQDTWYVDSLIPIGGSDTRAPNAYVRVGTDVGFLAARLAAERLRATLVASVTWAVMLGVLAVPILHNRRRLDATGAEDTASPVHQPDCEDVRVLGLLRVDIARREVTICGTLVSLTPKQFDLLTVLTSADRRVYSEAEILEQVWPDSAYADSNDIRQCIYRLRRRFQAASPGSEAAIVNVKGFGYQFDPEGLTAHSVSSLVLEGGDHA